MARCRGYSRYELVIAAVSVPMIGVGRRLVRPAATVVGACLLGVVACDGSLPGQLAGCQVYRPHAAKRTFDGRVGSLLVRNAGPREIEVKVYHPDGIGDVELRRRIVAGTVLALEGEEGARVALGNDWGIQVDRSCVRTLGQAAEWAPGEFSLRWDGDSLRPGLGGPP